MTMKERPSGAATDVGEFLTDLDGGQFDAMLSVALSKTAAAVVDREKKKGKVTITLDFEAIKGTHQVRVEHTVKFVAPTMSGKTSEEAGGATVLHVGKSGRLSLAQPSLLGDASRQTHIDG
jgi:hypothetical protein